VEEPETLGSYLKHQREFKRISLKEVAKNTRVREYILRAIEEDRYELLPPATYVKGFLSAYAKYLRLDESEVLLRYERVLKGEPVAPPHAELAKPKEKAIPIEPPKPKEKIFSPPSKPKKKVVAAQHSKPKKKIEWNTKQSWVVAGVVAASLILFYFFSPYPSRVPEPVIERPVLERPIVKEEPTAPSPPLAATTSIRDEKTVTSLPEKGLSLKLKAIEETWVSLQVDDQPGKGMTLKSGETHSAHAKNRIRMVVGNAGGLDLTLDGKPLGKFGKSGEVVTLVFTFAGVEVKRPERPDKAKE